MSKYVNQELVYKLKVAGFPASIETYPNNSGRGEWRWNLGEVQKLKEWIKSNGSDSLKQEVSQFLQDFDK